MAQRPTTQFRANEVRYGGWTITNSRMTMGSQNEFEGHYLARFKQIQFNITGVLVPGRDSRATQALQGSDMACDRLASIEQQMMQPGQPLEIWMGGALFTRVIPAPVPRHGGPEVDATITGARTGWHEQQSGAAATPGIVDQKGGPSPQKFQVLGVYGTTIMVSYQITVVLMANQLLRPNPLGKPIQSSANGIAYAVSVSYGWQTNQLMRRTISGTAYNLHNTAATGGSKRYALDANAMRAELEVMFPLETEQVDGVVGNVAMWRRRGEIRINPDQQKATFTLTDNELYWPMPVIKMQTSRTRGDEYWEQRRFQIVDGDVTVRTAQTMGVEGQGLLRTIEGSFTGTPYTPKKILLCAALALFEQYLQPLDTYRTPESKEYINAQGLDVGHLRPVWIPRRFSLSDQLYQPRLGFSFTGYLPLNALTTMHENLFTLYGSVDPPVYVASFDQYYKTLRMNDDGTQTTITEERDKVQVILQRRPKWNIRGQDDTTQPAYRWTVDGQVEDGRTGVSNRRTLIDKALPGFNLGLKGG